MAETPSELVQNAIVAVGVTSVQVIRAQARVALYLKNTSTAGQNITVVFGNNSAVLSQGQVMAVGDVISDSNDAGYECWQGQINAIADAAAGQLSVFER